jgi:hypothetical protein
VGQAVQPYCLGKGEMMRPRRKPMQMQINKAYMWICTCILKTLKDYFFLKAEVEYTVSIVDPKLISFFSS